jgi:hypothetical protein
VVYNAATNAPWRTTGSTGSRAYDTATVTTTDGFTATGAVSYAFYANGSCQGIGASAGKVTLISSGAVPNSSTEGPLAAGSAGSQG